MNQLQVIIQLGDDNYNLLKDIDLERLSFDELYQAIQLSMKLNETLLDFLKALGRAMEIPEG